MSLMDLFFAMLSGTAVALTLGRVFLFLDRRHRIVKMKIGHIRKIEKALPPFLDSVSSSLMVGNSLQQSIEAAARKDHSLVGTCFESILQKVRSGMPLDEALERKGQELTGGSLSLAFLSMASSYRSGGNMIEALTLLANICRERENLRKKIMARTAQSRTQGYVIIFVPVLFMLLLFVTSPHSMLPVLTTHTGRMLLLTAAVLQCLGGITIRAMLKQEIL